MRDHGSAIDPLFLFACGLHWRKKADVGAGWELVRAAKSSDCDNRAVALNLLAEAEGGLKKVLREERAIGVHGRAAPTSQGGAGLAAVAPGQPQIRQEVRMHAPYGLEITDSCEKCTVSRQTCFCDFSPEVLRAFNSIAHQSIFPAGALLFVEGQMPRGAFVLCAGKVKLFTTSREGRVLILKMAASGEVLGLSAAVSGTTYELAAETATPCRVTFVDREKLLHFLSKYGEAGLHSAQALSKEFQSAYQDIHDLLMARSSAGKLAKLLLSWSPAPRADGKEIRIHSGLTHEEMAQMIGSSRETVTRLLSELKKKHFIRLEGSTLVIRNRTALEALVA